jgi:hypothetical protein
MVANRKIERQLTSKEILNLKKARLDILNVMKVVKPTKEELDAIKPPDINKLINRGLKISLNIDDE